MGAWLFRAGAQSPGLVCFDGLDWTGDHANLGSSFQSNVDSGGQGPRLRTLGKKVIFLPIIHNRNMNQEMQRPGFLRVASKI